MDFGLRGKVAIVTGAAGEGLGRAHALALAKEGVKLALFDIVPSDESVTAVKTVGGEAKSFLCDISKASEVARAIAEVSESFGATDILINNASILTTVGMFGDIPPEKWERDVAVNLLGTTHICRAVWPGMLKKKWGRIVMISSFAGTHGGAGQTSYAATKAAVIGLAKSLALEGARANITVNSVAPGVIASRAVTTMIRSDMLDRMKMKAAMRRLGETEEIGNVVAFLCSEQASYITGQVIEVDGGAGLFTF